ncbi:hypothetical protein J5690_05030 [bacterium]|nr:hypothetical protein [bacterium]
MKKTLLFFTFFLFFAFLAAEDVKTGEYDFGDITVTLFEEREPEPEPEKEPEPEPVEPTDLNTALKVNDSEPEKEPEPVPEIREKPKFFYIQPALGFGTGVSGYRVTAALDAGFLVGSTEVANFYVGLDFDFRAGMVALLLKDSKEFAVQANGVFDFAVANPELKNVDLWISLGFDLIYGGKYHEEDFQDPSFYYVQAWGIGLDFVFTNNIILKAGIDGFLGIIPDLTLLVGYRF